MPVEGVDLRRLDADTEYSLKFLADLFGYSPQTLRKAIREGDLKARRRGKFLIVRGKDALRWWNSE